MRLLNSAAVTEGANPLKEATYTALGQLAQRAPAAFAANVSVRACGGSRVGEEGRP